MKEFNINESKIYYDEHLDGGGTVFGINALKSIKNKLISGKTLEMCSGPGFIGFWLYFNGYTNDLTLSDINSENKKYIEKTIENNNLNFVKFVESNCFDNIEDNFDVIISNPPHFKTIRPGGYRSKHEELISLDKDMNFHKKFFEKAKNYITKNGKIILIENTNGVTHEDIIELSKDIFDVEFLEFSNYDWPGKSLFYTIILKLK